MSSSRIEIHQTSTGMHQGSMEEIHWVQPWTWDIRGWYHKTFTTLAPESFGEIDLVTIQNGHWIILLHNLPHPIYTSSPQAPLLVHSNARLLHGACQGWHGVHVHLQSILVGSCSLLQCIKQYSEWNRLCGSVVGKYKLMLWKCFLWTRIQSHRKIITVTPTKKVQRARAQFPSKHCAMMYLMRIRTLMKSMFSPLKHAHLPTSPQDVNKHYARTPFQSIQKHCSTFDPWDLPPGSAPLLWAQEVQRTKRTPGDKAHHCQQFSHWQQSHSSQQLQTAELLVRSAMANCIMLLWNCHR